MARNTKPYQQISGELLQKYLKGEKKRIFYEEAKKAAEALNIHKSSSFPDKLIKERRPKEDADIQSYREKIYRSQTKGPLQKVFGECMKIRKADDYTIIWPKEMPPGLVDEKSPKLYFDQEFPSFDSVTNWAFTVMLQSYLLEAGSVVLMMPIDHTANLVDKSVLLEPYPYWYPCESVYEYLEDEYCILKSANKTIYKEGDAEHEGDIFYLVDTKAVTRYKQTSTAKDFAIDWTWEHGLDYMPAFEVKGQFSKAMEGRYLYESRLAAMVPHLDECAREYSDLQAEVVQHVHSEKWVFDPQQCGTCHGMRTIKQGQPAKSVECPTCKGQGVLFNTPYGIIVVKPAKPGVDQWRGEPAGFIKRDVEIIKVQDERIDKHIRKALAAVNMEHLAEVPLNQSGKAKEIDMEPANTTINAIAEDLIWIMDMVYAIGIDIRYIGLVPDEKKRKAMRPSIPVPTKLHILSAYYIVNEISTMRNAKVSPVIIVASEIELAEKKFIGNPDVRDRLVTAFQLDPLAGISPDDKNAMLQNKGILFDDYVISCNITRLVSQAYDEVKGFEKMDLKQKKEQIKILAAPIIEAGKVKIEVNLPPAIPPGS